jgi:aryl-alcohol dehydrogenase-like predicted oxidoreductase
MTPTQLALSWCYHRNHVSSTIIGATSLKQLDENIGAYDIRLDEATLEKINKVYKKFTDPTKGY